jgi:hypothetical protein
MNMTKPRLATAVFFALIASMPTVVCWRPPHAAAQESTQTAKISQTVEEIKQVNAGLPEPQVQAKTLIFRAMMLKQIPAASNWCEAMNLDGKLWPVTPTNTVFALNTQVAGRTFSPTNRVAGDVVVFFEAAQPGWNLAGGAELLTAKANGIAVALADGRALLVTREEATKLRWTPLGDSTRH